MTKETTADRWARGEMQFSQKDLTILYAALGRYARFIEVNMDEAKGDVSDNLRDEVQHIRLLQHNVQDANHAMSKA